MVMLDIAQLSWQLSTSYGSITSADKLSYLLYCLWKIYYVGLISSMLNKMMHVGQE